MTRVLLAVAMTAAALISVPTAQAQISASDRTRLQNHGFSHADFHAFTATEVSPNYRPFSEWDRCARNIASLSLQSGKSVDESVAIAATMCASAEREAVAVMAKSLGIAKAKRMLELGKAILGLRVQDQVRRDNPPLSQGMQRVGMWESYRAPSGECRITLINERVATMIEARRDVPQLQVTFMQVGKQKGMFTDDPVFGPREYVVLWDSPSSQHLGPIEFELRYPGADTTLRTFYPTDAQQELMGNFQWAQFIRKDISLNISFPIGGFRDAVASVRQCAAGG